MIVISDTTPIISLLKTGQLELLKKLFCEILIPEAVYRELVTNPRFQNEAEQIKASSYIRKVSISNERSVEILRRATGLDLGESEAIVYTDESKAELLLMDEAKGRKVAKQMGLKVMGTIGILIAAYDAGLLKKEEIVSCLDILKNSGRFISEALYEQVLQKIHNEKS